MTNNDQKTAGRFRYSSKSVLKDFKQYLSFFAALLIVQALFWTLLITTGINNNNTHEKLGQTYEYHAILSGLSSSAKTKLENANSIERLKSPEVWPTLAFMGGSNEAGYSVGVTLKEGNEVASLKHFKSVAKDNAISSDDLEMTPLYTDDPLLDTRPRDSYIAYCELFAALAVLCGFISYRCKRTKQDDRWGERVYSSTFKQNGRLAIRRITFSFMIVFAIIALMLLIATLSYGNGALYFVLYLALVIICALFLIELFNVRVNHYKFRYGIYMTFGAGFRKLYSTAIREMFTISLITLLPSLGISMLITLALYQPLGVAVFLPIEAIIGVLVLNILLVLASTYIPMKAMAVKPPIALIYAQDNSNLVSSPRRSFKVFGKKFPNYYELFGMWRFRRYFVRLTATAIAFASVFLCGIYVSELTDRVEFGDAEFIVSGGNVDEAGVFVANHSLSTKSGFNYLFWSDETVASTVKFHALLAPENLKSSKYAYDIVGSRLDTGRREIMSDGYIKTTDSFKLVGYDKTLIDSIVNNSIYSVEGDPYAILDDPSKVIVSNYIQNYAEFEFAPGDKLYLAVPSEFAEDYDENLIMGGQRDKALEDMIANSEFSYIEYEVAAVVDYGGQDGNVIFGINNKNYRQMLLQSGVDDVTLYNNISVFVDETATQEELSEIRNVLIDEFEWVGCTVTQTYSGTLSTLNTEKNHRAVIFAVSILVMLVSPLIWFFSQLQFYRRREKEMYILRSLGAKSRDIRKIYLISGIMLSALSAVMTLAMSYLADYLIYIICNLFVDIGVGSAMGFYMPPMALVLCLVTAVICGFLSSWFPYAMRKYLISKSDRYGNEE